MINFEEELKKFHPSMEIEEVEDAVRDHELTDMTDIMVEMIRQKTAAGNAVQVGATAPLPVVTAFGESAE